MHLVLVTYFVIDKSRMIALQWIDKTIDRLYYAHNYQLNVIQDKNIRT